MVVLAVGQQETPQVVLVIRLAQRHLKEIRVAMLEHLLTLEQVAVVQMPQGQMLPLIQAVLAVLVKCLQFQDRL